MSPYSSRIEPGQRPLRIINAVAPIRICDNGGWTDTWFAGHGKIFNIGVSPCAEVQIAVYPAGVLPERILIHAENYGERFAVDPERPGWQRHPLLEAAIELMNMPGDISIEVSIFSEAPAGASIGTSSAVTVALIGALDALTPGRLTPHEVAYKAHAVEVDMLGQQCGIQDQLCSAYGGVNMIEMFKYPHATVSPIRVAGAIWWELERRLVLIYLGKSHHSSEVHEQVIRQLEGAGSDCRQLNDLRATAEPSRDAVYAGDFATLGRAMIANTEAQSRLHPELVGPDARRVIEIARAHGALGWKVNGAGGKGGSITLLCDVRDAARRSLIREIEADNLLYRNIPITLDRHGLRIWETL
ncbi:MAG TPA: GHMP kinase [Anaerolineae bacterium]